MHSNAKVIRVEQSGGRVYDLTVASDRLEVDNKLSRQTEKAETSLFTPQSESKAKKNTVQMPLWLRFACATLIDTRFALGAGALFCIAESSLFSALLCSACPYLLALLAVPRRGK